MPLQDLGPYQNSLDYRTCAQDVCISGGHILPNNVLHSASGEALRGDIKRGDIKMVQEFVSSTLLYILLRRANYSVFTECGIFQMMPSSTLCIPCE